MKKRAAIAIACVAAILGAPAATAAAQSQRFPTCRRITMPSRLLNGRPGSG